MKSRRIIMVLSAVVVFGLCVLALWPRNREPEYKGKKLSEWLETSGRSGTRIGRQEWAETRKAMRAMGTNALPFLLKWIKYETPGWKGRLHPLLVRLPAPCQHLVCREETLADRASEAFGLIGADAEALPALEWLWSHSGNRDVQRRTAAAFLSMGIMPEVGRRADRAWRAEQ